MNIGKTEGLVVGQHLEESDTGEVQLKGHAVVVVEDFTYLGSNITRKGEIKNEVSSRIAKAARAFGCLSDPIFHNTNLSLETNIAFTLAKKWASTAQHSMTLLVC